MVTWTASAAARRQLPASNDSELDQVIATASDWLARRRAEDGHWVFELEADATIPAEYIFLNHFLGEINGPVERKIGNYLRRIQGKHGGWPLFHDGDPDISATVRTYYALKVIGDDPDAPHMRRAREVILAAGGAAQVNVFTRFLLALFGQVPWRAIPVIRPEAMLLPKRAPFHVEKVSYWSRTTMVPMFVLAALKPSAVNPRAVGIRELFHRAPEEEEYPLRNPTGHWLGDVFLKLDRIARISEPLFPSKVEQFAIDRAMAFLRERLNGEDGVGAIFPPMVYTLMCFKALGQALDHPDTLMARRALDRLLVIRDDEAYVQPCLSPVWDTGLALHAMMEAGVPASDPVIADACAWLRERQILDVRGDWASKRPSVRPGGWAFQYRNNYYPDVDDTAVVGMALHRADEVEHREAVARAAEWIIGMQSENGGWGAFDADNEYFVLENMPFADHGALLDPPTVDVTARCLGFLVQAGYSREHPVVARGLAFLRAEQEEDGSWFGRWGTNYIYGTWSVLAALNGVGEDLHQPYVRKAVDWLKSRQRPDGGWGEDCASYWPARRDEVKASTPSQTAWALLGLMAVGEVDSPAVKRGVDYLVSAPREGGHWREEYYNAVGFPRVFYLKYHGYSAYFPLWALARYRTLKHANRKTPAYGI